MPLYEYRCGSCEKVFEVIQSFSSRPKRKCEECGGALKKLVSRSGFVLKGGGWYKSDYGSGSSTPASRAGDSSSEGGGDGGSGDSKAASGDGDAKPAKDAKAGGGSEKPKAAAKKGAGSKD